MGKWITKKISDIGKVVGGATPSTKHDNNYGGDISWITPKDLASYQHRYVSQGERNLTQKGFDSCSTVMLPKGSILFSSRAPIGYVAIAAKEMCTNQGFKSIVPNKTYIDPLFLYYLLKFNAPRIAAQGSGTTFPEVSTKTMASIEIFLPESIEEQHKIARILDSIDSKSESNRRVNDNLAKQAMLIYQQLLGTNTLSKGHLRDIATITMGQSPSGSSYNEDGIGTVFYQGRTDFGFRFPTRRLYTTEPKKIAAKKDVLLSVRAPVGDINVANESCCIGRGLSALRSLYNTPSFLYYTMVSLRPRLDQFNGEGTVFGSVSQDSLNNLPIYIPPVDQIASFEATVAPLDAMIMNNNEEIMRLTELRDYLLPRLLNGQISIGV